MGIDRLGRFADREKNQRRSWENKFYPVSPENHRNARARWPWTALHHATGAGVSISNPSGRLLPRKLKKYRHDMSEGCGPCVASPPQRCRLRAMGCTAWSIYSVSDNHSNSFQVAIREDNLSGTIQQLGKPHGRIVGRSMW